VERRTFVQDFFFELMRDSQRVRAAQLAERDRWIRGIAIPGREEILFELEMLLRGLDRFFNPRNLFADAQPPQGRDYKGELKAARDAIHRAIHLARRLTVPTQEQALLFRSFLEGSLADDRARARLGAELREQRTPEESLFLLRSGLVAHQGILDHLLQLERAPQGLYLDVGRALQHELFVSRYFCPPAALEFRAEYDRVASVALLDALRDQEDERRRKAFALGLLALFRMLRTLRYVPGPPTLQPRRVLVVLALARSELWALAGYLETDLPRLCAGNEAEAVTATGRTAAAALRSALEETKAVLLVPATVRGQIDALLLEPEGGLVIDYKLAAPHRSPRYELQLGMYELAAHELVHGALPIRTALAFLKGPARPIEERPPLAGGREALRSSIGHAGASIAEGRAAGRFALIEPDGCREIDCGFFVRCHGNQPPPELVRSAPQTPPPAAGAPAAKTKQLKMPW